ncbi:MAG: hypothetical protein GEV06_19795 [Luteitalea sp.]|nr:hypothetical protein [Luteitalea sp.]
MARLTLVAPRPVALLDAHGRPCGVVTVPHGDAYTPREVTHQGQRYERIQGDPLTYQQMTPPVGLGGPIAYVIEDVRGREVRRGELTADRVPSHLDGARLRTISGPDGRVVYRQEAEA